MFAGSGGRGTGSTAGAAATACRPSCAGVSSRRSERATSEAARHPLTTTATQIRPSAAAISGPAVTGPMTPLIPKIIELIAL